MPFLVFFKKRDLFSLSFKFLSLYLIFVKSGPSGQESFSAYDQLYLIAHIESEFLTCPIKALETRISRPRWLFFF